MEQSRRFGYQTTMPTLRVAFDALPLARWGSLFHVLLLERPGVRLEWLPREFPRDDRPLLDGAEIGLFVEPPLEQGLAALTVGSSPMVVLTSVGHRLARHHELRITDVLAEPFFDAPHLNQEWRAFWTLDSYRGGPPPAMRIGAENLQSVMTAIASGEAIGTFAASLADGLPHPGIIWLPLIDGPMVATRLVWRADDTSPAVRALVDIACDMLGDTRDDATGRAAANG
jgi:DNA-binding transcriptional LysR family regulator